MDNKETERDIEQTLASWDGVERVGAGPFFATRLQARLESEEADTSLVPARGLVAAVLAVLVLVNAYSLVEWQRQAADEVYGEGVRSFAQAYNLQAADLYEQEAGP